MTCLLMALILSQTPFVHETVPGPDQLPVIIEFSNGEGVVGSFDGPNWQAKLDAGATRAQGSPPTLLMKLDQPWPGSDRTMTIALNNVKSWYRETAQEWLRRHRDGWTKAGYVDRSEGDPLFFVWGEEAKYAEKAQAWADEAYPPSDNPPPADLNEVRSVAAAATESPPGFLRQWGAYAGIVTTGAVLALAVWKTLLSG